MLMPEWVNCPGCKKTVHLYVNTANTFWFGSHRAPGDRTCKFSSSVVTRDYLVQIRSKQLHYSYIELNHLGE